ncbi:MAG: MarR family winged helix-turn-helix transcriptional regulator [Bacteroidia bacterium]
MGYLLAHSVKALTTRLLENFSEAGHNLTKAQWFILAKLYHFSERNLLQSEVVEMMLGDKTQVTRAVDDLVKREWIKQEIDQNDRRNRVLTLTKQGKLVVPELMQSVHKTLHEMTQNIKQSELETTKKVLNQIIENSKNINQ